MSIWSVAFRNIRGNPVKSLTIFICVMGVAALFVSMTLIIGGARNSLSSGLTRLGADIVVMPAGAETKVESALLMGKPTKVWMPAANLEKVAAVQGVEKVSPQIYLQSLFGASCCSASEMFLVVFDPASDFSVTPWLDQHLGRGLAKGEVIGGSYISTMGEPYLVLYGYNLDLVGTLEPTGMGIDQTLFMTRETAQAMSLSSLTTAVSPLEIPRDQISAVMIKVAGGNDPHAVALRIQDSLPGAVAVESPNLFGAFRKQIMGILSGFTVMTSLAWVLSAVVIGLVFSMATHERRREIAVLRSLGFRRSYVFRSVWVEAALIAAAGSVAGITVTSLVISLFQNYIAGTLGMPFLFPSPASFSIIFAETLLISLATVSAGVFIPAYTISQQEPALAMRE